MVIKSTRQRKANVCYAEYLNVETNDIGDDNMHLEELGIEDVLGARILEYVLTQHSLNKGLKLYGEKGYHSIKKELKQLHDMAIFKLIDSKNFLRKKT